MTDINADLEPHMTGVGRLCAPGPERIQRSVFLLRFEDHERSDVIMFDEKEARFNFARAEANGWNCYLFELAKRNRITNE